MSCACRFHRLRGVHANGVRPFAPSGDRLHPTRPPHVEGGQEEAERGLHSCLHRKRQWVWAEGGRRRNSTWVEMSSLRARSGPPSLPFFLHLSTRCNRVSYPLGRWGFYCLFLLSVLLIDAFFLLFLYVFLSFPISIFYILGISYFRLTTCLVLGMYFSFFFPVCVCVFLSVHALFPFSFSFCTLPLSLFSL